MANDSAVMSADTAQDAPAKDSTGPLLERVTEWLPGAPPRVVPRDDLAPSAAVRWFELGRDTSVEEVMAELGPLCEGLDGAMAADLIEPDEAPCGASYAGGGIRLASAFRVAARRTVPDSGRGRHQEAGMLVFEPVELLAGSNWLITCWHPIRSFYGADELEQRAAVGPGQDLYEHVEQQWAGGSASSAGDLGLLIMHELALDYTPVARTLSRWVESAEVGLYTEESIDPDDFGRLWGEMAVLRDWINPLNPPGLHADMSRAWLPATSRTTAIAVNDRVDKALEELRGLASVLRASFGVLHVQQSQAERDRSDQVQRRIELMAAGFLVPTLVVGFYGANTWIPGQGQRWGFWAMIAALVLFSVGAVLLMSYWHRQQKKAADQIREERRALRRVMARQASGG